jgi:RNA polymerase sigma-32 factor
MDEEIAADEILEDDAESDDTVVSTSAKKDYAKLPSVVHDSGLYAYLQKINKFPSLTYEEEFMLAKAYLEDKDLSAAHRLITSHLKLVAKIALSYRGYGLSSIDLISEGNLGLMHAVKKFDPDLGYRLSTYAMWWIKASIQEYILRSWSLVKISSASTQKKLFFSLNKIKNKIRNINDRDIIDDDLIQIAADLGVSQSDVMEMNARLSNADLSLNTKYGFDDSSTELIDMIPDAKQSHDVVMAHNSEVSMQRKLLMSAIDSLTEREKFIIMQRKLKEVPVTLECLSEELNISKERVRQIETRSFDKIQQYIFKHAPNFVNY